MRLRNISLFNFRNYDSASFEFSEGMNCILGNNGVGKTNLLDAVHFLSLSKSAFAATDTQVLRSGQEELSIRGEFVQDDSIYNVAYYAGTKRKKVLKCNDDPYLKLSDHIGRFPSILIHPHDVDYVRMSSDWRRKLFDGAISQVNHEYLERLIKHNRVLKQRNQALKNMREAGATNSTLLDTYDQQLLSLVPQLYTARKDYLALIGEHFSRLYAEFSNSKESVNIIYKSHAELSDFEDHFKKSREVDILSTRTTMGVHKDEFEFRIDNESLKSYGSQGQQKSFMLALKLCPLEIAQRDKAPILLLDDIFDRLDTNRITSLLNYVTGTGLQVFLTDARPDRVKDLLTENGLESKHIYI